MKKCDLCGEEISKLSELIEINKVYQTTEVKEVCTHCADVLNKYHFKASTALMDIKNSLMKTTMKEYILRLFDRRKK